MSITVEKKKYSYDLRDVKVSSWIHRKLLEVKFKHNFKNMTQVIRYLLEKAGEL
jgi:hypothetical protein